MAHAHRSLPSRLVAIMVVAAGLCVAAALVAATRLPEGAVAAALDRFSLEGLPAVPTAILIGAAVAMVSQLARLRVRAGGGLARLAWGEAAIVVLLAFLPPQVVPPVALLGFAAAHAALHLVDARASRARPVRESVYGVAALTVGASLATSVMVVIWGDGTARAGLPTRFIAALCAAAAVYFVVTFALVVLRIVAAGGSLRATVSSMVTSTPFMLVGNVTVGLVIVWACATSGYLLLLLPPVLWLMHQFYANRIGEDDERRTWAEFADVARDLNRLDERDAARAGIAGAVRLFHVPAAEIVLSGGRSHGDLPPGPYTSRALTVGSVPVGELRLAGPEPQRPRDRLMLATFGDALAAALHDAITHGELRAMSERTTYDAVRDPLTGLLNRAALLARGNVQLSTRPAGAPVALLLLDVNDFKEVNNALGHTAGDEVLKVIARRVQGIQPETPDAGQSRPVTTSGVASQTEPRTPPTAAAPTAAAEPPVAEPPVAEPPAPVIPRPRTASSFAPSAHPGPPFGEPVSPSVAASTTSAASISRLSAAPLSAAPLSAVPLSPAPHLSAAPLSAAPPSPARLSAAPLPAAPLSAAHEPVAPLSAAARPAAASPFATSPAAALFAAPAPASQPPGPAAPGGPGAAQAVGAPDASSTSHPPKGTGDVPTSELHARLGGDEFAILITDLADGADDLALAAAVDRARRLGALIAAPMEIDGVVLSKETSIGVVVAAAGSADLTELLRRADIAMYQAKNGGQPVAWYDPARDDASTDRLALLAELREALSATNAGDEQLVLDLQPAIALTPAVVSSTPVSGTSSPDTSQFGPSASSPSVSTRPSAGAGVGPSVSGGPVSGGPFSGGPFSGAPASGGPVSGGPAAPVAGGPGAPLAGTSHAAPAPAGKPGGKSAAGKPASGASPAAAAQVTSVEALIRWRHPRRGRLTPAQFLPAVEASELIGPLTHWVLERAIFLASSWRRSGLAVPVAVNISARSLAERQLPETIRELLARYRLPAELLILEITETVMLSNSPVIDDVLSRVRRLGVQLAVDDFGTGYSAFTLLTRVPVQEVKIDREFVAQMLDSPKAGAIVQTTVDLARRMGLRVVAEGVENPEQRARLAELGCTAAQGFLFYPPMSPESLQSVLRERRQVQRRHLKAEGAG